MSHIRFKGKYIDGKLCWHCINEFGASYCGDNINRLYRFIVFETKLMRDIYKDNEYLRNSLKRVD